LAKLFFRYGAMNSGKSTQLLQVRHNYHERGQKVLLVKPEIDDRDGRGMVTSRVGGLAVPADHVVLLDDNLMAITRTFLEHGRVDCVIVDECQFLAPHHVHQLSDVADKLDIPVMCYGLRADFKAQLFPATEVLMAIADNIEEIKTICWCGKKATINARTLDGNVVYAGPQVLLGGNDRYTALCRKHWKLDRLTA
jgi:thymidine kinase